MWLCCWNFFPSPTTNTRRKRLILSPWTENFNNKQFVEANWNVMAHAQKPDFVFSAKWRIPFKSAGASVQSTTVNRDVRISGSNAGYAVFRGSVKDTGYPLHSPVSSSLPLPCITVCHHVWTGVYVCSLTLWILPKFDVFFDRAL